MSEAAKTRSYQIGPSGDLVLKVPVDWKEAVDLAADERGGTILYTAPNAVKISVKITPTWNLGKDGGPPSQEEFSAWSTQHQATLVSWSGLTTELGGDIDCKLGSCGYSVFKKQTPPGEPSSYLVLLNLTSSGRNGLVMDVLLDVKDFRGEEVDAAVAMVEEAAFKSNTPPPAPLSQEEVARVRDLIRRVNQYYALLRKGAYHEARRRFGHKAGTGNSADAEEESRSHAQPGEFKLEDWEIDSIHLVDDMARVGISAFWRRTGGSQVTDEHWSYWTRIRGSWYYVPNIAVDDWEDRDAREVPRPFPAVR